MTDQSDIAATRESLLELDLSVEDAAWCKAVPDLFGAPCGDGEALPSGLLRAAVGQALSGAGALAPPPGRPISIAMLLADDARIAGLNAAFRNKPGPTNILSFPGGEEPESGDFGPLHLGDLALARETVFRECEEQGKSGADHVLHLVVHGVLHLLGYDHADERSALEMEALERRILAGIGIADPYGDDRREFDGDA